MVEGPHSHRLSKSVYPAIVGAKVIMVVSLLERLVIDVENCPGNTPSTSLVMKDKLLNLGFDKNWYGWEELAGIMSLRHCFAHEFGKITDRQCQKLIGFLQALNNQTISDGKGAFVPAYFTVKNGEISLKENVSDRLRLLSLDIIRFLETKGLVIENSPS